MRRGSFSTDPGDDQRSSDGDDTLLMAHEYVHALQALSPLLVGPRYFPYSYGAHYVYGVYSAGGVASVRRGWSGQCLERVRSTRVALAG